MDQVVGYHFKTSRSIKRALVYHKLWFYTQIDKTNRKLNILAHACSIRIDRIVTI